MNHTPYCSGCSVSNMKHKHIPIVREYNNKENDSKDIDVLLLGDFPMKSDNNYPLTAQALQTIKNVLRKENLNIAYANAVQCKVLMDFKEFKFGEASKKCSNNIYDFINVYKPKLIVAYGKQAAASVGIHGPITEIVGRVFINHKGNRVLVNFHPREIYKNEKWMELFDQINENILDLLNSRSKLKYEVKIPKTTEEALNELKKLNDLPEGTKVAFDIETLIFSWDDKKMTLNGTDPYSDDNDILTISFAYKPNPEDDLIYSFAIPMDVKSYMDNLKRRFRNKHKIIKILLTRFNIPKNEFVEEWASKKMKVLLNNDTIFNFALNVLYKDVQFNEDELQLLRDKVLIPPAKLLKDKGIGLKIKDIRENRKKLLNNEEFINLVLDYLEEIEEVNLPKSIQEEYNVPSTQWKNIIKAYSSENHIYREISEADKVIREEFSDYDFELVEKEVLSFLENNNKSLIAFNAKFELKHFLQRKGIKVKNIEFDTMLLRYQLKENQQGFFSLKKIVSLYLPEFSNYEDEKGNFVDLLKYNALDSVFTLYITRELYKDIIKNNEKSLLKIHKDILIPATYAFAEIELVGVSVDKELIDKYDNVMSKLLEFYNYKMNEISSKYGIEEIEPTKSDQVATVIYGIFEVPPMYTETNKLKTNEEAIDMALAFAKKNNNKELERFLMYYYSFTKIHKQYTSYVVSYKEGKISDKTGRIHPSFNLNGTVTGRVSSSNPNFQQIPRSTVSLCPECLNIVRGKECPLHSKPGIPTISIKSLFSVPEGKKFVAFDYSQLEVRVLAAATKDPEMLNAIKNGLDMHSFVGSKIFGYTYDEFYKKAKEEHDPYFSELRSQAKKATFGVMYGSTSYNMANELGISPEEAQGIIDNFYKSFPTIRAYIDRIHHDAINKGKVYSIAGRIRHFIVDVRDRRLVSRIKRQAQNFPIQSAGNDVGLVATYKLVDALKKYNSKVVGYVHDSIEIEADENYLKEVIDTTKEIMENDVREIHTWLEDLPLVPDLEMTKDGRSWADEPGNTDKILEILENVYS